MKDKNHNINQKEQDVREQEITEKLNVYHEEIYFQNRELLRSQEALEKSKNAYMELFHNAPAGYVIYSNSNELIKANSVFSEMIGVNLEKVLGTYITDYIDQSDQDDFYFHKKNLLQGEEMKAIYLKINQSKSIAISSLIEIDGEKHFKTIVIQLPKGERSNHN